MSEPDVSPARSWAERLVTTETVYGSILVAGLIVAFIRHDDVNVENFVLIAATIVAFWLAHLYAGAVSNHSIIDGHVVPIGEAIRKSSKDSFGMLQAAVVPMVLLFLGVINVLPDAWAVGLSLWSVVVVLAFLGYFAFEDRGATMFWRIVGSIVTAAFGVVIIFLKAFVH